MAAWPLCPRLALQRLGRPDSDAPQHGRPAAAPALQRALSGEMGIRQCEPLLTGGPSRTGAVAGVSSRPFAGVANRCMRSTIALSSTPASGLGRPSPNAAPPPAPRSGTSAPLGTGRPPSRFSSPTLSREQHPRSSTSQYRPAASTRLPGWSGPQPPSASAALCGRSVCSALPSVSAPPRRGAAA